MSDVSPPVNRASHELLKVKNLGSMKLLEFMDGHTEDELPDLQNHLRQTLQSFQSLKSISLKGLKSSLYLKDVLNEIASQDNIALVELIVDDLTWKFFEEVPESWQGVFVNLKTLHIEFGDEFDTYTPECVSGLKRVLGWASTVEELHCEAHWDLFWDDIAIVSPSLKHLKLNSCKVTESFLRKFRNDHPKIEHLDMFLNFFKKKEDKICMEAQEIGRMFCLPLFNGIRGTISQDYFESTWGMEISHEHVKYIPKEGREEIYLK